MFHHVALRGHLRVLEHAALGGRRPNAAFWLARERGRFTPSRYYLKALPEWAERWGVTELLARTLGKNPATTVVTIDEVETDNWGIGGETVTERRKK